MIKSELKKDEQTKNAAAVKTEGKPTKNDPAAQMPPYPSRNTQVDSKALVVSAPKKKSWPSLSIPEPNASTILDTCSRLHCEISASGYGVGIATRGPVTGDKAYFQPVEQKISDVDDQ